MITIVATVLEVAISPLPRDTSLHVCWCKGTHSFWISQYPTPLKHCAPHLEGREREGRERRESRELSPLYCVETNGFVRLYTNRLLTHQSLVTLSDDHLALKELRFTPFGARGFCDTN